MTRDEIMALEAGRELDALVAEKVFKRTRCPVHHSLYCCNRSAPRWSTDIAAAWSVVEKLAEIEGPVSVVWGIYCSKGNKASVMSMFSAGPGVVAPTAPLAICRAALLATLETS